MDPQVRGQESSCYFPRVVALGARGQCGEATKGSRPRGQESSITLEQVL
jgi:hypothetical protein